MKFILIISMTFIINLYGADVFKEISIYPFGIVKHFEPTDKIHEGNMEYFAVSKIHNYNDWNFESGVGTFIDSYSVRSYRVFTNISHKNYKWGILTPMLAIDFFSKGKEYESKARTQIIRPSFKLRIGEERGLFVNIQPIPKIGDLTNGFVAIEFGYKF